MVRETKDTLIKIGIITTFLVLGTYNAIFDIMAFLIVAALIIKDDNSVGWIVFLNPFSEIFKLTPTGNTISTILLILYVIYSICRKHELNRIFVIRYIIFCVFVLLSSAHNYDIARTIKFFFGILFIYYALSDISNKTSIWNALKFYILGVLISSIISYSGVLHNPSLYYGVKRLGYVDAYQSRFAGMYGDPNYYTVNVIIAICLVEILGIYKKVSKKFEYLLLMALVSFSLLTLSKSAMLLLIVPVFVMIIYFLQIKDYKKFVCLIGLLAFVLMLLSSLNISQIATIVGRFTNATDANSLTTGRFNIWMAYLNYFHENLVGFLFGSGVGATYISYKAPHNTYIDFVFYFGLVGSFLFVLIIAYFNRAEYVWKRNVVNYSIYISLIVAYIALSETFYFDFPIHLLIGAIVFRLEDFLIIEDYNKTL